MLTEIKVEKEGGVVESNSGGGPTVVKFEVLVSASALPVRSFTPEAPPMTLTVYGVPAARGLVGSSVAANVTAS
jgi:hypothetical protein